MKAEIVKNLFGVHQVKFDCPGCKERLRAKLTEAGTVDQCPTCFVKFKVPGESALKQLREKQAQERVRKQQATEQKQAAKEERRRKQQEEWEQLAAAARTKSEDDASAGPAPLKNDVGAGAVVRCELSAGTSRIPPPAWSSRHNYITSRMPRMRSWRPGFACRDNVSQIRFAR